jgi:hypothetical protein
MIWARSGASESDQQSRPGGVDGRQRAAGSGRSAAGSAINAIE